MKRRSNTQVERLWAGSHLVIIYREALVEFFPMATMDLAEHLTERLMYYLARCGLTSGRSRELSVWKMFKR